MAEKRVRWELKADDQVSDAMDKIMGKLSATDSLFKRLGSGWGALTSALSVGSIVAALKGIANAGDEAFKAGQKAGVSAEVWQQLDYAIKLAGGSSEVLSKGLKSLSTLALDAKDGGEQARDTFKRMGVDWRTTTGAMKSSDQLLLDLAERFKTMPEGMERSAMATKIFGKAGLDLLPFLLQGRDGIQGLMEEAVRLGIVLDNKTAAASEAFNDNLTRITSGLKGVVMQGIAPLIPFLDRLAERFTTSAKEGDGVSLMSQGITVALKLIASAALITAAAFETAGRLIGAYVAVLQAWYTFDWGRIPSILKMAGEDTASMITRLKGDFNALWNGVPAGAEKPKAALKQIAEAGADAAKQLEHAQTVLDRIMGKDTGFDPTFHKDLQALWSGHKSGKIPALKSIEDYTAAAEALMRQQPKYRKQLELDKKAWEDLAKAEEDAADALKKNETATRNRIGELVRGNVELQFEISLIGRSRNEIELLTLAHKERQDIAKSGFAVLDEQIKKEYEHTKALVLQRQALDKSYAIFQRGQEDQLQAMEGWGDLAGNVFKEVAVDGASAADVLRREFKSLWADLTALFAKKLFLQIAANVTGNPSLGAAAGQAGQGTPAGSLLNLFTGGGNSGGGLLSNLGSLFGGMSSGGGLLGSSTGLMGSFGAIGDSLLINAGAGLSNVGLASAGSGVASMAGGALSGVLGAVSAALPWVAAAVAIYSMFAKPRGGDKQQGAFAGSFDSSGLLSSLDGPNLVDIRGHNQQAGDAQNATAAMAQGFFQTLKALGGPSGQNLQFGMGWSTDPKGTAPSFAHMLVRDAAGNTILKQNNDNVGRDPEDLKKEVALLTQRGILAGLQTVDFGEPINAILRSIDASSSSLEAINKVLTQAMELKQVMDGLGKLNVTGLTPETLALMKREGETLLQTFERIAGGWSSITERFTTDEERLTSAQTALSDIFTTAGVAMPTSIEGWETLITTIDASTESGRSLINALSAVPGSVDLIIAAYEREAAAREASLSTFDDLIGKIRPGYTAGRQQAGLDSALGSFMAGNAWTSGMSSSDVLGQLILIQRSDYENYSQSNKDLINEILKYYLGVQGLTKEISQNLVLIDNGDPFGGYYSAEQRARREEIANLSSYLSGLITDKQVSPLDDKAKLEYAQGEFERLLKIAQGGGSVTAATGGFSTLLGLARENLGSSPAYNAIFQSGFEALSKIAGFNATAIFGTSPEAQQAANEAFHSGMLAQGDAQITEMQLTVNELREIKQIIREQGEQAALDRRALANSSGRS